MTEPIHDSLYRKDLLPALGSGHRTERLHDDPAPVPGGGHVCGRRQAGRGTSTCGSCATGRGPRRYLLADRGEPATNATTAPWWKRSARVLLRHSPGCSARRAPPGSDKHFSGRSPEADEAIMCGGDESHRIDGTANGAAGEPASELNCDVNGRSRSSAGSVVLQRSPITGQPALKPNSPRGLRPRGAAGALRRRC
jgi:hypothetical protein